ncbi:MAG TPA: STAS domain-containing protein [Gaiellaceae bacterium]|nr:STAS domain-containing protein [Gaiellaceae bacterium]
MVESSPVEGNPGFRVDPVAGVDRRDGSVVVRLAGELDLYNAQDVRQALLACTEAQPDRLVVDLSGVEFIDSTVLGVLIEARSRMAERQAFMLAAPGTETSRALAISGLDRHFGVHPTVDEALAAEL